MSTKPNKALIAHITALLGPEASETTTRWAIAIAHYNELSADCTMDELDELMAPDAETVGDWLGYLAEGGHGQVFTDNPDLFRPVAGEEEADEAADAPFMASIEVAGQHYVYNWSDVAESLTHPDAVPHDEYLAGTWESYASNLLD